ncbi:prion-inhibition and propagation-domain-containing protein [Daldinia vernicosa]|uniref:prion-inhibition and propagation-domain-containing protein n=1 Tax=Daldinia vernicosa TaxID=114800 RepID=UPI00200846F6|nr:prion-inhibition and propagation-domain-containing protein [Daldinia vernicosa]KAI0850613.1 prion-inhibition and propagation-domain-containing protein [Daldinia vernicosa]
MAEIAGLVLGVAGLVGVIGAFRDAIDLFNDFMSSREFGRDYEILETKFDIERTILLQWSEQVGLLRPDYDRRLDDVNIQCAIARILGCIKLLIGDEAQLKDRYGLGKADEQRPDNETGLVGARHTNYVAVISGHRMAKFVKEFEAMKLRSNIRDKKSTTSKRIRWVVRDKARFEELVKELNHFTTKLTQIVPISDNQTTSRSATDKDVATIRDLRGLKLVHEAAIGSRVVIAELTQEHITRTCQEQILCRLWFRTIDERRESISEAHHKTLRWALAPPEGTYPWDDLSGWLQSGSGIYWVSGKAGSGKSTLMKHIIQHKRTRQLLSRWAGNTRYFLNHYFFYNMGNYDQKSQEGLSRTLLYQILSEYPSLISEVLPNMWKQLYDSNGAANLPSVTETKYAFRVLATKASQIGKFCFFIDGLDEFVGNYLDSIDFLRELATNSHIKIVVSSRPIPDCVASFDGLPSLDLHHLTRADIRAYVEETIGSHRYMQGLLDRHPDEATAIMEDLVDKSSGVFLWVILACRSLILGFADYDRIHELRRRVDELPPELEEMFQHMLNGINKRHREQGSRMLRICFVARQARDRLEYSDMTLLGLALIDDDYTSMERIPKLSKGQKRTLCEELEGRLRSRTGGLLETYWGASRVRRENRKHCFCGSWGEEEHDVKIDARVIFMHRTVFEFLSNEKSWDLECLRPPDGLQAASELSLIGLYSSMMSIPYDSAQATRFLRDGFEWGAQSDIQNPENKTNIFWVIQPFIDTLKSDPQNDDDMLGRIAEANESSSVVIDLAVEAGAINFLKSHLPSPLDNPSKLKKDRWSALLYQAVSLPLTYGGIREWIYGEDTYGLSSEMASLLISHGGDPNYEVFDPVEAATTTPWLSWLESTSWIILDESDRLLLAELAEIFLRSGAEISEDFRQWAQRELQESRYRQVRKAGSKLLDLAEQLELENPPNYSDEAEESSEDERSRKFTSGGVSSYFNAQCLPNLRKREGDVLPEEYHKRARLLGL